MSLVYLKHKRGDYFTAAHYEISIILVMKIVIGGEVSVLVYEQIMGSTSKHLSSLNN